MRVTNAPARLSATLYRVWLLCPLSRYGSLGTDHDDLAERCRLEAGREATPSAGIIDSQSVRTTDR